MFVHRQILRTAKTAYTALHLIDSFTASLPALGLRESPGPLQKIPEQPANLVFRCLIRDVPRRIKTLGGVVTIRIASAFRTR
jgi:hypothetical protein